MRFSPLEKINIGFLVALGLVAIVGVSSMTGIQRFTETSRDVTRRHAALAELQSVLARLAEAESAQRGFVITGDEQYVGPYSEAAADAAGHADRLQLDPYTEPQQHERIIRLGRLVDERLSIMDQVIEVRRQAGADSAGALVGIGRERVVTDSIRRLASEFEANELSRLEQRSQDVQRNSTIALLIIGGGSAFAFLVVLGSGIVIRRDITERRRAERALRNSETLLSQFMENLPIGVMVVDALWQPRFANNAAVEILGPGVLIDTGGPPLPLRTLAGAEYSESSMPLARALAGQTTTVGDAAVEVDGRLVPLQVSAAPIYDAGGRIAYAITAFDDISERRRDEEALRSAVAAAETASRTKSDFLARMSHELRTPLNSVIGFATILLKNKRGNLQEQDVAYLERILDNGRHLLLLINDILDLSKIEAGKVEVDRDTIDLPELVGSVVEQFEMQDGGSAVRLVTDIPEMVDPVLTDPARLRQILINLVGNAVKFTEEGSVRVAIELEQDTNRAARIRVSDTGIGIPADRLRAIFDAFEQAESSTTRKYGGTGLGLPISRALCELLGYQLSVTSEVGAGTEFVIDMRPGRAAGAAALPPRPAPAVPPQKVGEPTRQRVVLVVDEDDNSRRLLTEYVEDYGCRVVPASSAATALSIARESKPDLITVDLSNSQLDGWELLRGLKEEPELAEVPVVIVSVVADERRASLLGAVELVQKPVERSELLGMLRRVVGDSRGRILLVDDEPDARQVLADLLDDHATELRTAGSGQEALGILRSYEPDLVITDLLMPEMDGMTFLEIFRATPRFRHVPVIVVSGKDVSFEERQRLSRHTSAVLSKGTALEKDLDNVLGSVLGHAQGEP